MVPYDNETNHYLTIVLQTAKTNADNQTIYTVIEIRLFPYTVKVNSFAGIFLAGNVIKHHCFNVRIFFNFRILDTFGN